MSSKLKEITSSRTFKIKIFAMNSAKVEVFISNKLIEIQTVTEK